MLSKRILYEWCAVYEVQQISSLGVQSGRRKYELIHFYFTKKFGHEKIKKSKKMRGTQKHAKVAKNAEKRKNTQKRAKKPANFKTRKAQVAKNAKKRKTQKPQHPNYAKHAKTAKNREIRNTKNASKFVVGFWILASLVYTVYTQNEIEIFFWVWYLAMKRSLNSKVQRYHFGKSLVKNGI